MNTEDVIDDLQSQLDELKASLKPEPPFVDDGSYVPPDGENAWLITGSFVVGSDSPTSIDAFAAMGLSFKYRRNAIRKRDQVMAQAELRKLAREHDPDFVADFTADTSKCYPTWDNTMGHVFWLKFKHIQPASFLFCSRDTSVYLSANHADLLKVALGVWDE